MKNGVFNCAILNLRNKSLIVKIMKILVSSKFNVCRVNIENLITMPM